VGTQQAYSIESNSDIVEKVGSYSKDPFGRVVVKISCRFKSPLGDVEVHVGTLPSGFLAKHGVIEDICQLRGSTWGLASGAVVIDETGKIWISKIDGVTGTTLNTAWANIVFDGV
jgi:hypothetical protein